MVALAWVNSPLKDGYDSLWSTELSLRLGGRELSYDLRHWVNDGLMTLFFLLVGLEIARELSVGEYRDRRAVLAPALAALGGLVVPALVYLAIAGGEASRGWGIAISTDTAFASVSSPWSVRAARTGCASSCSPSPSSTTSRPSR